VSTVLVVFLFLNSWRSTVITGLALPISVLAAFVAVWAFGFTLNMMTLLGLSLAIGILIDDAIVVRENIVRHIELGKDHETAARLGTSEIGLAVAATTFSIVAVFVPIAFMGGIAGQWFKPFALTMASSVLVSLFISFSLDPMLSAHWPGPHRPEHRKAWITRQLDRFNRWFDRLADRYHDVLAWALPSPGDGGHCDRLARSRDRVAGGDRRDGLHAEHRPERDHDRGGRSRGLEPGLYDATCRACGARGAIAP
jgi:HAE1 family hydrophobic/amphiphilic exporter-1